MISFLKKHYFSIFIFIFFLIISSIYFWPFLSHPAFNLIDDGMSVNVASHIYDQANFSDLVETTNGRVRPFYWLYFVVVYAFSGTNPLGYWIGQTLVVTFTLLSLWYLISDEIKVSKLKSSILAIFLSILFFIPAATANFYRLGTAEVRQIFLIILFMIWMKKYLEFKANKLWGIFIFVIAILTKETALLVVPMLITYIFPFIANNYKKYKGKICSLFLFVIMSLIFYSIVTALKESSEYAANFSISLSQIKTNLMISRLAVNEIYYIFILFMTFTLSRIIIHLNKNKVFNNKNENEIFKHLLMFWQDNSLQVASLVGIISSLFFVFSWEYQLERYYYPVYIFLLIFITLEFNNIVKTFKNQKNYIIKILLVLAPILILLASYGTIFQKTTSNIKNYLITNNQLKTRWFGDYQNSYSIIKVLLGENFTQVYTLVEDYEIIYEFGIYSTKFNYKNNNIKVFSHNKDVSEKYKNIYYLDDVTEKYSILNNKKAILITKEDQEVDLDSNVYFKEIISNEFLTKHSDRENWVVWRSF